ncbi:PAS domain S-box protein [Azotobacter chroococcum]|uniref:PAS domain-containing protein n=1 Tax=Azotobacter chroococcum TaxID=353 RepID=UPI00103FEBE6|nr:PAS domain-containing protein [Azotobacter chroococcum]TBW09263.1 PAS domain S-box protein [Azotobacter chroococcum]
MSLERRILLPAALWALLLLAVLAWADWPRLAPPGLLAVGLALWLALLALALRRQVRRPLAELVRGCEAPAADGDDFARLAAGLRALHERLEAQQAELARLGERCAQAERACKLSEERFALALRGAGDGLWERDLDNGRLVLSARWKSMLGYAEEEFPDRLEVWREHVHPQDLIAVEIALDSHLQGALPRYECQYRVRHKDGRYRWLLSRGCALRHANGRAYRMVGLDTDVSPIKRVEHILEEVVEGTAGTYGEDFFQRLVQHFAGALEVSCAFITECADQPPTRVRTLAFWSDDRFLDNLEYDLPGTPCEAVIRDGLTCFHPAALARKFPVEEGFQSYIGIPIFGRDGGVLGHLAFLDRRPMDGGMLVDAVFRLFAARAAAELERKAMAGALAQRFG